MLAATVEAQWAVLARLDAGILVVTGDQTRKPHEYGSYPRPDWIRPAEPKEIVVHHVADALHLLRPAGGES